MTIVDGFRRCAGRFGDRVAVRDDVRELTYAALREEASRLAAALVAGGVRRGDVVGVHLRRSADGIVALLAVLQAGAAYLALDVRYPAERIRFMLADSNARMVVTQRELLADLPDDVEYTLADEPHPAGNAGISLCGDDLAYVAYTSGSTGKPKGVMVPHRAVERLVVDPGFVHIGPDDVVLQLAPVAFDASTLEIWGALLNGARLVVPPAGDQSLAELTGFVRQAGVTVLWLTAGLFHQVVDFGLADLAGVRYLLAGGDVLSVPHVNLAVSALPGTTVVNGYGPTENTTFTCCHPVTGEVTTTSVPIGRPINGTTISVLDEDFRPAETGELHTSGAGLAHGYLGRPSLTAERFVPDPLTPGGRMYRTGDLVRQGADGVVEFLGRADRQVKIRGFRIELGEIEAAFAAIPAVAQHVVLVRTSASGDRSLHAAVVLREELSLVELRRALGVTLPSYAVPSPVTVVDALPLTVNGKVDTAALESRIGAARPDLMSDYRAPATATEVTVAALWSDHLGIPGIGADDDFFELGGHSLLGVRIIAELHREFGVEVSPRTFYLNPTPAGMASAVTREEVAV
jgi:amino acid adenylation domain-containing protein